MNDSLAPSTPSHMVPGDFAEKAMASLMQMHTELMDEKERRVELYRKLMEREQALAELRMYVKMLEEQKARHEERDRETEASQPMLRVVGGGEPPMVPPAPYPVDATPHLRDPQVEPPMAPRVGRSVIDGWKTW